MAMRAATMGPMAPLDTPSSTREPESLFRKVVLLFLLITAAVLWTVLLFKKDNNFPLLLSTFFADVSLGLIAGFGSRFFLHRRDGFVRFLIATSVAVIGMIMIGSLTNSVLGIGPVKLERKFAEQLNEIDFNRNLLEQIQFLQIGARPLLDVSKMDWADPVHLGISIVMMLLSLHAWRRPAPTIAAAQPVEVIEVTPQPAPAPQSSTRSRRGRRATSLSNGRRARVQRSASGLASLNPNPHAQPGTGANNGSRSPVLRNAKKIKDPVVKPKRRRSRRKPQIQFAIVEEHRCPYCLDAVTRTDPRGVEECKVCHTLHHADCWAITGVCQVPHLNN